MSTEATGSPDTRVTVATLRGEVMTELAKITGAVSNLADEVRRDREARDRAEVTHDRVHADQAREIAVIKGEVKVLSDWHLVMTTTEAVAPKLTWGRFFGDVRTWVLVAIAAAGPLLKIFGG